jgi:N-acetylmuramidase/Putative peptidoglycan binding domain
MNKELWNAVQADAEILNIEAAALLAVIEVESAGKYFAIVADKQEPLIRFEGHYFDQRLTGTTRARARLRGIASPFAGHVKNPASQTDRWALLSKAIALNSSAALESTSWGLGQVMGAHWKWLGYNSVDELVETARSGLAGQVELMVRYIEKSGLAPALRAHNWAAFARGYNGSAYAKNGYHIKLAKAYATAKIDIKSMPIDRTPSPHSNTLRKGDKGEKVEDLQRQLTALGYIVAADGIFNGETEGALKRFQRENSIAVDGVAGGQTSGALAKELPQSNARNWLFSILRTRFQRLT